MIVNVHHLADMVVEYLKKNDNFGMRIEISREEILLDTGGGLKKAKWFFREDSGPWDEPFIITPTSMCLARLIFAAWWNFIKQIRRLPRWPCRIAKLLATCCSTSGVGSAGSARDAIRNQEIVRAANETQALAFSGVHVISPRLLGLMAEDGAFSIITSYLRLAGLAERILGFRADEYYWRDLGKPENIAQAAEDVRRNACPV